MSGSLHSSSSSLLLRALSEALGQQIVLDESGQCGLDFEGWIDVVVARTSEPDILSLRSAVTPVAQALDADLLQDALAFNYLHMPPGYAIGLDAASHQLVLLALVDAASTTQDEFVQRAAGFLDLVPRLRAQFAEPRIGAGDPALMAIGALA